MNIVERLGNKNIHMYKNFIMAFIMTFLIWLGGDTTAFAQGPDPATVDLRALERQILTEVNNIRTNPQGLATNLNTMKQNGRSTSNGRFEATYPDGEVYSFSQNGRYLDTALTTAQGLQPINAVVWSDGLYQAAYNYAQTNPRGHRDGGTTPQSRAAPYGSGGVGELIAKGGATGQTQVYDLFIDDDVTSLGHRNGLINSEYTHLGAGCFYGNRFNNITCVLVFGIDWVEEEDELNPEFGRQFAYKGSNGTFQYIILKQTGDRRFPYRAEICPGDAGLVNMPDLFDLTTVESAQADGLVATNNPCPTSTAPYGIRRNGTALAQASTDDTGLDGSSTPSLANTATAAPASSSTAIPTSTVAATSIPATIPPAATATSVPPTVPPAATSGQLEFIIGEQYAYRVGNNFHYVRYWVARGPTSVKSLHYCPHLYNSRNHPSTYDVQNANEQDILTVADALALNLTPMNVPCEPSEFQLVIQQEYAYVVGNTFYYVRYVLGRGRTQYFQYCPYTSNGQSSPLSSYDVTVDIGQDIIPVTSALALNLTPMNTPCT